jgi:putative glutamine amidotransferase
VKNRLFMSGKLREKERGNAPLFLQGERDHSMNPVIGIPCEEDYRTASEQFLYGNKSAYIHAVKSAGGLPLLLPVFTHLSALEKLFPHLDGLLLPGGADIQPTLYGERRHPNLNATDPNLDAFEIALITWALQKDLPLLGICRGMQLINVVLGGTLYQDLPAQYPGSLEHWRRDLERSDLAHRVIVERGSLVEQVLGTHRLAVNSLHHQAIKDPGKDIRICGWADDGVAEFLEVEGHRFVLGIQGHPEELYQDVPAFARLFQAFITVCASSSMEEKALFYPLRQAQKVQAGLDFDDMPALPRAA